MIRVGSSNYYLIPIVASVHTHAPCRSDGTNGVSHRVGTDDRDRANANPEINHWVVGVVRWRSIMAAIVIFLIRKAVVYRPYATTSID